MRLPLVDIENEGCLDYGSSALFALGDESIAWAFVWVGTLLAMDRLGSNLQTAPRVLGHSGGTLHGRPPRLLMTVFPAYAVPYGLVLSWNVFTSLSIVLVATTARSMVAILFKTLHVLTEAAFLVQIMWAHNLRLAATVAVSAGAVVLGLALLFSCDYALAPAAYAGLVMDSTNIVAHIVLGLQQPDNAGLWSVIHGFGWHALYLTTFVVTTRFDLSDEANAVARILGMYFNLFAIHVFTRLLYRDAYPSTGAMSLAEWRRAHAGVGRALWQADGCVQLEDDDGQLVPLHETQVTAYAADDAAWRRWLVGTCSAVNAARRVGGRVRAYLWCFPLPAWARSPAAVAGEREGVLVPPRWWTDVMRGGVALVVGIVAWRI